MKLPNYISRSGKEPQKYAHIMPADEAMGGIPPMLRRDKKSKSAAIKRLKK